MTTAPRKTAIDTASPNRRGDVRIAGSFYDSGRSVRTRTRVALRLQDRSDSVTPSVGQTGPSDDANGDF